MSIASCATYRTETATVQIERSEGGLAVTITTPHLIMESVRDAHRAGITALYQNAAFLQKWWGEPTIEPDNKNLYTNMWKKLWWEYNPLSGFAVKDRAGNFLGTIALVESMPACVELEVVLSCKDKALIIEAITAIVQNYLPATVSEKYTNIHMVYVPTTKDDVNTLYRDSVIVAGMSRVESKDIPFPHMEALPYYRISIPENPWYYG